MAQMPIKPLSFKLVEEALEGLSKNSAPGTYGFAASTYVAFRSFFAPLMFHIFQDILPTCSFNQFWAESNVKPASQGFGLRGGS